MQKTIIVAGATGNLGERIVKNLLDKGAIVRALVRPSSHPDKINHLEQLGATIIPVNPLDIAALTAACKGGDCVVSALAGLEEVIIDAQKALLDAAVAAGVPRFIPSDYSLDFTKFSDGENRNLDLRRKFHAYLATKPIAATTIFNGAFADMLTNEMPLILFKQKLILYWGNADHPLHFTTIADVATFTAYTALDPTTPRFLWIAGDQISPRTIKSVAGEVTGNHFRLFRTGGLGMLSLIIKIARKFDSDKKELYPAWQGMQYMRNMIDTRATLHHIDNNRYAMHWTDVKEMLQKATLPT
jgi:nucleoside-diphosphate-sugar epimerase